MTTQRDVNRRYYRELTLSMVAYVVTLVGVLLLAQRASITNRVALAAISLVPMIPVAGACVAIVRFIRDCDELERQIQLSSLAITVLVTAFVTFSYGFLEGAGFPRLSMFVVWPLMGAVWLVSSLAYRWYYR
jgi:FlaA1/EpsC-like NDP-sugar epimerase